MSGKSRALSAIVLLILLSLSALAPSQTPLQQPDLIPGKVLLSPSSPVSQGVVARISVTVSNGGTVPAGEFEVEISWRRVDEEEICGFERVSFPGLEVNGQVTVAAIIDTVDLTPGEYEVTVRADPDQRVAEVDETNNRISTQLAILPPKPELHPISLQFDPASPVKLGETVRVTAEIENTGESTAGEFQVQFLRCQGEIVYCLELPADEWDPFGSALVPGLKREEHLRLERVLDTAKLYSGNDLDALTPFAVKVRVDEPDGVGEQDDNNNAIIGSLGIKPSKLARPELHPVSVTFNKDLPLEWDRETSQEITATVLVINSGGSPAPIAQDKIRVRFSYRKLGEKAWTDLPDKDIENIDQRLGIEEGDNSDTAKADLKLDEPGSYELRVWVDPDNEVDNEQNENNNQMIVGFSVKGSELHPLSIELGGAPIHQGDTIAVASEIENTGEKTAESFTVGFFIDNLRFDTFYYKGAGLEEDDTVKVQGTLDTTDLPPGSYTLRVFVDPDDKIPELDEANNVISTPLKILKSEPRHPELHSTSLTLKPPSPVRGGQPVRATATIWNTGNIEAERFQVELAYSQDGRGWTPFAVQDIPELPRGGKRIIEGRLNTAGLPVGVTYRIRVLVDPQDEVEELDEGNNRLIAALSLAAPGVQPAVGANLKLKKLTLNPPSPVAQGTQVQVCAEIANVGQGPAGEFSVEFLSRRAQAGSFVPFTSKSVPTLAVGRSITICEVFTTAGLLLGNYEIKVIADADNSVQELDETDNELVRTLIISQAVRRPDLHAAGLTFEPASPVRQGQPVRVCVKVVNPGAAAAGQFKVSYSYLLDGYVQFATARATGLAGGGQIELCRALDTSNLSPGSYEIKVVIDPENQVAELNEANNELGGYLTVRSPFPPTAEFALGTGGPVRLLGLDEGKGTVYIASEDGRLYALEREAMPKSGFPFDAGSPLRALALDTGAPRAAYLGTAEGKVYVVGLDSGKEICQVLLDEEIGALGVDKFGNIYVGTADRLVSLTPACAQRWEFAVVGAVEALSVNDPRDVIYAATSGGLLYALGRDGTPEWQQDLQSPLSALALGEAIYAGTEDGKLQAVDFNGQQSWSATAGGAITGIAVDGERDPIYVASTDGKLYCLDLSGNLRWIFSTGGPLHSDPVVDVRTGSVLFGSDDGKLYAVDGKGEEIFKTAIDSPVRSNPVIDVVVEREGAGVRLVRTIYLGAENGNVYLIKAELSGGS